MIDLVAYLNESIVEENSAKIGDSLNDPKAVKDFITKHAKDAKTKKAFESFIKFITDKLDNYEGKLDDFADFVEYESFTDFLNEYQKYGLKPGADEDFDDMDFDKMISDLVKFISI